jgi:hypothetical protein
MKMASLYYRSGVVHVAAVSLTKAGWWLTTAPFMKFAVTDPSALGRGVVSALDHSTTNIADPDDLWEVDNALYPIYGSTGLPSWYAFAREALSLNAELDAGRIKLLPYRRVNKREPGYVPLPERAVHLPADISPENLGNAVVEAFSLCEPRPAQE